MCTKRMRDLCLRAKLRLRELDQISFSHSLSRYTSRHVDSLSLASCPVDHLLATTSPSCLQLACALPQGFLSRSCALPWLSRDRVDNSTRIALLIPPSALFPLSLSLTFNFFFFSLPLHQLQSSSRESEKDCCRESVVYKAVVSLIRGSRRLSLSSLEARETEAACAPAAVVVVIISRHAVCRCSAVDSVAEDGAQLSHHHLSLSLSPLT